MVALFLSLISRQEVTVTYEQFAGLQVKLNGIPFIRGSSFRYIESATGRSLYSSRWAPKSVSTLPDGTIQVRYSGDNGNAIGTLEFTPKIDGLTSRLQFRWRGRGSVKVDNTLALVWAPVVSHSDATCDGQPTFELYKPAKGAWEDRKLCGPGKELTFDANLAKVSLSVRGAPVEMYDGRGFTQDWAKSSCLFWLGQSGLKVVQGETVEIVADWKFQTQPFRSTSVQDVNVVPVSLRRAVRAPSSPEPLVPKPKAVQLSGLTNPLSPHTGTGMTTGPEAETLKGLLSAAWDVDDIGVDLSVTVPAPGVPAEGYELDIQPTKVHIRAADKAGLRRGIFTLSRLARAENGRLVLPCGTVRDWPSVKWRGVHLFAGKDCLEFQSRLFTRLLAPLGFNNLVVECGRCQWDAVPAGQESNWLTKEQLQALFEVARKNGLEPTPLIQSMGHMDWLLDGELRKLAVNPATPYTLDTRKEAARTLIGSIWEDAIETLKPDAVHFGLDETDMRGMPDDPTIASRLWKLGAPDLMRLAKKHKVKASLWGDMMLSKDDAPDAAHATTAAQAAERRSSVAPGSRVFDWHYVETDDPTKFKSLAAWAAWGMEPVAASWYKPRNIRSHTLAAIQAGAGTLQTTWAGYQNDQASYESNPEQLAAYVTAADYAWSGRSDLPSQTGYDPMLVARRLLWPDRAPLSDQLGKTWLPNGHPKTELRVGPVTFNTMPYASLNTPLTGPGSFGASSIVFSVQGEMTEVDLAMDSVGWETEAQPIAKLVVTFSDGSKSEHPLRYGAHLRAPEDERPTLLCDRSEGLSLVRIRFAEKRTVSKVELLPLSVTAGVRVRGITTW